MKYEKSDIRKGMLLEFDGGPVIEPVRKSTSRAPVRYGDALDPPPTPAPNFKAIHARLDAARVQLETLRDNLAAARRKT